MVLSKLIYCSERGIISKGDHGAVPLDNHGDRFLILPAINEYIYR